MKREVDAVVETPFFNDDDKIIFCQPCCLLMQENQYAIHMTTSAHRLPNGKPRFHDK